MIDTHLDHLGPAHQYLKVIYDLLLDLQGHDLNQLEPGSYDQGQQGITLNTFEVGVLLTPVLNRMSEYLRDHLDVQTLLGGQDVYGFAPYQKSNQLLDEGLTTEDALDFTGLAGEVTLPAQARETFISFLNDVHCTNDPKERHLVVRVSVSLL